MKISDKTSYGKKGVLGLDQVFGAVMAVVLISVLLIIGIFILDSMQEAFGNGISSESNVTNEMNDMIEQLDNYPALIGIVGVVVFLGLVIGVLASSFMFGARSREDGLNPDYDEDEDDLMFGDEEYVKCYICGEKSTDNYNDKPVCDDCYNKLDEDGDEEDEDILEELELKPEKNIEESKIINTEFDGDDRVVNKKW